VIITDDITEILVQSRSTLFIQLLYSIKKNSTNVESILLMFKYCRHFECRLKKHWFLKSIRRRFIRSYNTSNLFERSDPKHPSQRDNSFSQKRFFFVLIKIICQHVSSKRPAICFWMTCFSITKRGDYFSHSDGNCVHYSDRFSDSSLPIKLLFATLRSSNELNSYCVLERIAFNWRFAVTRIKIFYNSFD
jgi:hypothetical protein